MSRPLRGLGIRLSPFSLVLTARLQTFWRPAPMTRPSTSAQLAPITWQALVAFFSGDCLELDGELGRSPAESMPVRGRFCRDLPFGVAGPSPSSL